MPVRNICCSVADPTTAIVYEVSADYRESCGQPHETQREHLCELTVRTRPMRGSETSSRVCDIAVVPTPVLVAIQTKLRALRGQQVPTLHRHAR